MVKLASVRVTRLYGPDHVKNQWELANSVVYLVATILAVAGFVCLLPGKNTAVGLWCLLLAMILIAVVNAHDLYAQLAGFDFRLPLVTLDPQLALIEIAAPLVHAVGALLFLIGIILFLRVTWGSFDSSDVSNVKDHAYSVVIAGSTFWLLGSILNAFQLYESAHIRVQFMQKMVSVPFVIASTLLLVSTILSSKSSHLLPAIKVKRTATWFAIVAGLLLLFSASMNIIRVLGMQEADRRGGGQLLEPLRGGAQEELEHKRDEDEVLLHREKYAADVEEGSSYTQAVVEAEVGVVEAEERSS